MMTSLTQEHPTATHFLFIAASGEGGSGGNESAFAWWVMTPKGEPSGGGNSTLSSSVSDWYTAAMFDAALEAVTQGNIPKGGHLHVISDLRFFTNELNRDRSERRANGYLKTTGKPMADAEKLRQLDVAFDKLNLTVSAGSPKSDLGKRIIGSLKDLAITFRSNIDNPGDWTSSLGQSVEIGGSPTTEPKGPATNTVPDFPDNWEWTISNDIPPPIKIKLLPKKRRKL